MSPSFPWLPSSLDSSLDLTSSTRKFHDIGLEVASMKIGDVKWGVCVRSLRFCSRFLVGPEVTMEIRCQPELCHQLLLLIAFSHSADRVGSQCWNYVPKFHTLTTLRLVY